MKYALSVEVKLQEIPDDEMPAPRPGDDPMAMLGGIATKLMTGAVMRPQFFMGAQAGFDFRKQITVGAGSFQGLAEIIGRFDNLVSDIEAEKLRA